MGYDTDGMIRTSGWGQIVDDTPCYCYLGFRLPVMPPAWRDEGQYPVAVRQNLNLTSQIDVADGHTLSEKYFMNGFGQTHKTITGGPVVHEWQDEYAKKITEATPFPQSKGVVFSNDTDNPHVILGYAEYSVDTEYEATVDGVYLENTNDKEFDASPFTYAQPVTAIIRDCDNDAFEALPYKAASAFTMMFSLAHAYNFIAYQNRNTRSWPLFSWYPVT